MYADCFRIIVLLFLDDGIDVKKFKSDLEEEYPGYQMSLTEDVINTILNDLSVIDEDISFNHDWKLNNEIVESDLCAKCGTCSVVCPNDLVKFNEKPFISEECLRKGHGMCAEVCPRQLTGSYDVRNRLDNLKKYYHAKSEISGQSGGVITKFLQKLLDDGELMGLL